MKQEIWGTYRNARRIVISVIGGTVLLFGVIMLVTPGPGILGVLAGLAILGLEFTWAKRWLNKIKEKAPESFEKWRRNRSGR